MCEMEVNAFLPTDAILQAMAHNTSTIDRDGDMVVKVLEARGEFDKVEAFKRFQDHIHRAYAIGLDLFGEAVAGLTLEIDGTEFKGFRNPADEHEKSGNEKASGHTHMNADGTHTHDDGTVHSNHNLIIEEIVHATAQAHPYETR